MRIVMTGGTAGIGLAAVGRLVAEEGTTLVIGARDPAAAPRALAAPIASGRIHLEPLDLAALASVDRFIAAIAQGPKIDRLVLNAGLQVVRPALSADGFELTFAVNHLAHFKIARDLVPHLAPGARVILTASGTHDPEARTGMPAPRHADADKLAYPERDERLDRDPGKAGRRAYSTSKLCNVMTARALAARLALDRPDVMVAAFDPGFTPGTGLARAYPRPLAFLFRRVLPLVARGERTSTPANSGRLLADLVLNPAHGGSRGDYHSVRGTRALIIQPSTLARDEDAVNALWSASERLIASVA